MVTVVNSKADVLKATAALSVNCSAARSLQEIMKSNLGPRGTLKMLVGGAGQIKITKDGRALLDEMQIQHPTACMIARASTAQDEMTGDGTTTNVLFIGELLKLSEQYLAEGLHPRMIVEGFDLGRTEVLKFLEEFKKPLDDKVDKELLQQVARTSLRTKIPENIAEKLVDICVESVTLIDRRDQDEAIDLNMVEILTMKHKTVHETRLVKGMVLDHGARHPDMPEKLENCFILTCNVSFEYEKTEVNSGFFYSSADQRDALVASERNFTDDKVRKVIELKRKMQEKYPEKSFVIINQKGIDGPSLESFAREGIIALRRAKRRNMERLVLACGGNAVNSVDDLEESDLGYAGIVYEHAIEDDKFTFVEQTKNPTSCSVLVTGPNEHTLYQMKDALRDGLRSVQNTLEDGAIVPGAGAFEVAASAHLENYKKTVTGKQRLGVEIFAKALLCIPKTLMENSGRIGLDVQEKLLDLLATHDATGAAVGIDLISGESMVPEIEGVWDNYRVKKQLFNLAPVLAQQLLLVDEIIRAGVQMKKPRN